MGKVLDDCRSSFECWAYDPAGDSLCEYGFDLRRGEFGDYVDPHTECAWKGWSEAWALKHDLVDRKVYDALNNLVSALSSYLGEGRGESLKKYKQLLREVGSAQ